MESPNPVKEREGGSGAFTLALKARSKADLSWKLPSIEGLQLRQSFETTWWDLGMESIKLEISCGRQKDKSCKSHPPLVSKRLATLRSSSYLCRVPELGI